MAIKPHNLIRGIRRQKLNAIIKLTDRIISRGEAKFSEQYRLFPPGSYLTFALAIRQRCVDLLATKTTDPSPT